MIKIGTTGASIVDNTLKTTGAGEMWVKATIKNGKAEGIDVTNSFKITVTPVYTLHTKNHPVCGLSCTHTPSHAAVPYTELTQREIDGTLRTGNYYLAGNLTAGSNIFINGDVNLCLNGYTLNMQGHQLIQSGGTLNLSDCKTGGKILRSGSYSGALLQCGGYSSKYTATLNLYGGTLESQVTAANGMGVTALSIDERSTANLYGGEVTQTNGKPLGDAISNSGTLNLYGGTVSNLTGVAIFTSGSLTLSGSPTITRGGEQAHISVYPSGNTFSTIHAEAYTGEQLLVWSMQYNLDATPVVYLTGTLIQCNKDDSNRDKFTVSVGKFHGIPFTVGPFYDETSHAWVIRNTGDAPATTYTVTFNSDGGDPATATKTVTAPDTTVGELPAAPVKTGHTFGGWFTAKNGGGTEFKLGTTVTGNLTVYAKWTANPALGGSVILPLTQENLDKVFGEGNATFDTTTDPDTITIKNNINAEDTITIPDDVILDLNGNTITGPTGKPAIIVTGEHTNLTVTGPGAVIGGVGAGPNGSGAPAIKNEGTGDPAVNIGGGASITGGAGTGTGNGGPGIDSGENGDATIGGGSTVTGGAGGSSGGNGGHGVTGGAESGVIVGGEGSGTVTGGNGGNGATGGNGGSGIVTGGDIGIFDGGTVTGGNGGTGTTTGGDGGNGASSDGVISIIGGTTTGGNGGSGATTGGQGGSGASSGGGISITGGSASGGNGGSGATTGGQGGNGASSDGDIAIGDDSTVTGGSGGSGATTGGQGGNGASSDGDIAIGDASTVTGGNGGSGASGGQGGNGTSNTGSGGTNIGSDSTSTGGSGGSGTTAGGTGGNGASIAGDSTVAGSATGGTGGSGTGIGQGGNGGNGLGGSGSVSGSGTATGGNGGNAEAEGSGGNGGAALDGVTGGDDLDKTSGKAGLNAKVIIAGNPGTTVKIPDPGKAAEAVLTPEEKVNDKITGVTVTLTVENKTTDKPDAETVEAKKPDNTQVGAYFDIVLEKTIKETDKEDVTTPVTETEGGKITVTITIPADMRGGSNYVIIRVHGGIAETIETTRSGDELTFETDKFSTYAIAYTKAEDGGSTTGGGSSRPTYRPDYQQPEHGDIVVTPANPNKGDTVTITTKPDTGYVTDQVTVTDKDGKDVPVKIAGDGKFTFIQPSGKVSIAVTYQPAQQISFTDVQENDWFYDGVKYAYEHGLMQGTTSDQFSPYQTASRGMVVTILWRLEGAPETTGASPFADVSADAYYAKAVAWAAENGIVKGYGNGGFGPNDPITREQLAAILWRYAGSEKVLDYEGTGRFTDTQDISSWAAYAVTWALSEGILTGKGNGILDPGGKATRAETAVMLERFANQ